MKVTVTQKHIKRGLKRDRTLCPVALAIKEKDGVEQAYVDGIPMNVRLVTLDDPFPKTRPYTLPASAREFIRAFDSRSRTIGQMALIKPFTFVMRRRKKLA